MEELEKLHDRVKKDWSQLDKRVIGHILRSPAISLGVGQQRFTEDWGIFVVDSPSSVTVSRATRLTWVSFDY